MPLTGEYEPSASEWARTQAETYEASKGTEANEHRGVPIVVMTSLGAKSGKLRKTPIMRVEHDGVYAVFASKGGAHADPTWYRNVIAHPLVELQDGPEPHDYSARVAEGEERELWWGRGVAVWPDYADYQAKTDRVIPVLVLERVAD